MSYFRNYVDAFYFIPPCYWPNFICYLAISCLQFVLFVYHVLFFDNLPAGKLSTLLAQSMLLSTIMLQRML